MSRLGSWLQAVVSAGQTLRLAVARTRRATIGGLRALAGALSRAWLATVRLARAGWARVVAIAAWSWRLGIAWGRIAVAVVVVSLVLAGGAVAASRLAGQFGVGQSVVNALAWADRPEVYSSSTCQGCHPKEASVKVVGLHAKVGCQTCHGPLNGHPGANPNVLTRQGTPASDICITCHAQTPGKPAAFPTIELGLHYSGGVCLRCHDPHTIKAFRPPDVTHPLANLPACTTCHNPTGLKKVPAGHELVADTVCLSCHATPERAP